MYLQILPPFHSGNLHGRTTEDQDKDPSIENFQNSFIKYLNLLSDAAVKSTIQKDEAHKTTVTLIYPQIDWILSIERIVFYSYKFHLLSIINQISI